MISLLSVNTASPTVLTQTNGCLEGIRLIKINCIHKKKNNNQQTNLTMFPLNKYMHDETEHNIIQIV